METARGSEAIDRQTINRQMNWRPVPMTTDSLEEVAGETMADRLRGLL